MATLYTPMQMQDLLGVSATALRIYTNTYPTYLSTEATGKRRKFTDGDLCFLSFVKTRTDAGDNHKEVLALLQTDEGKEQWQQYQDAWEPPDQPLPADDAHPGTDLVPVAQLHAVRLLWEDAQRREQEAKEEAAALQESAQQREKELQEQINQLLRELGHKEGELAALRSSKRKGFWARLFGSGE
jgi:DNA-binding transcriptional MerR regulator